MTNQDKLDRALHLAKLIPIGRKKTPEKAEAVHKWAMAIKEALAG